MHTSLGVLPIGAQLTGDPDEKRVVVDVTDLEHHVHTDHTWNALMAWNSHTPTVFLRGDTLTRVSVDEGYSKLVPFVIASMRDTLSETVIFATYKHGMTPDGVAVWTWHRCPCPRYVPSYLLARTPGKLEGALRINRVVEVPVFGSRDEDGNARFLGNPGYDPESRTYYEPAKGLGDFADVGSGWEGLARHDRVRDRDVGEARACLLDHLLVDFPFADDASKAHAVAMLLEPFVREAIGNEPTPMYGVMAHTPGTGKGYLTQACLGVSCGATIPVMTFTGGKGFEAAENRKALTAKLITAPPVIYFDNINEPLDSGVLAAALTATRWEDRILGVSKMADVPIRNMWVFTANNPTISRELTRRIVPIYLDTGDVDPRTRTNWTHPLPKWANEHRYELVEAALMLARNYFEGEDVVIDELGAWTQRAETADVLATYPSWSTIMGGMLQAAGIPGFLGNLHTLHELAAIQANEDADFLADWYLRSAGQPFMLRELRWLFGTPVGSNGVPWAQMELPLHLSGHGEKFEIKLGAWLRDNRNTVLGGYRVKKVDGRPARWAVEKIGV